MSADNGSGDCSESTPLTAKPVVDAADDTSEEEDGGVPPLPPRSLPPSAWRAQPVYALYAAIVLLVLCFCAALWSLLPPSSSPQSASRQLQPSAAQVATGPLASLGNWLQGPAQGSSCRSERWLEFSCLGAALGGLEHGEELVGSQSLSGLYAVVRAQLLAAASERRLFLNTTGCDAVRDMDKGEERDAGLLCCDWQRYFRPLPPCEPPAAAAAASLRASAFTAAAVVSFDPSQHCLWDDELWSRMRALYPAVSPLQAVQAVTRSLLRPSASFARHLSALEALLPASPPPLFLHIPPLPPRRTRRAARTLPADAFINAARYGSSAANASSLVVIAGRQHVQELSAALRHLQVTDLLTVLSEFWATRRQREHAVAVSVVLLSASLAQRWLGLWSSVLPQLALLASPRADAPLLADLEGEVWTGSCWSFAPHVFRAEHTPPAGFNIPAMTALLSSSPSSPSAPLPLTELVLVLGNDVSSVMELERLLLRSSAFALQPSTQLSAAYSQLFARVDVDYPSSRASLIQQLRELAASKPPSRLLLSYTPPDGPAERALTHYHQPSLLASLLSFHSLPLSLRVLVLVTQPEPLLRSRLLQAQQAGVPLIDRLLPEGKVVRDVLSGVEAELKAMDPSLWRVFQHERLFRSHVDEDGRSLARWLQLDAQREELAVAAISRLPQQRSEQLFPPQAQLSQLEQLAVTDLLAAAPSMQLFHTAGGGGYDYHRSALGAMTQRSSERRHEDRQRPAPSMAERLQRLQHGDDCSAARVLVFDGFGGWEAPSSSASSQLLQLLQSLSLALAAGRRLLVPAVPGSVTDFLQPMSECSLEALGMQAVRSAEGGWRLEGAGLATAASDPLSEQRVVVGRGAVLDVAYLAAWNAQLSDSSRYLSLHDWVGELLRFILRPVPELGAAARADSEQVDAAVLVPAVVSQPLSWYVSLISAVVTSRSLRRLRISSAFTAFQHVPTAAFLPLLELNTAAPQSERGQGQAMVEVICRELRAVHPELELVAVQRSSGQRIKDGLRELLQASRAPLLLGSMGSLDGFVLAALVPSSAWLDFFAYHFASSLLALNAHSQRSGREQQLQPSSLPAGVLKKTVESAHCRFLYVAGLEGTGHHSLGHLLASTRRFSGSTLVSDWLEADSRLGLRIWRMFSNSLLKDWDEGRRLLAARIPQLLQERCRPRVDGSYPTFVLNTMEDNKAGEQSWPNMDAHNKASLHTSLPVLAALFQQQGADFRVLVLTRAPGSLLASTALHRRFAAHIVGRSAAFLYEARVLRSNLASLDSDLQAIDPRFVLKLALDQLPLAPLLIARRLAAHLALAPQAARELEQAALRTAERMAHSHPEDQWLNEMTEPQAAASYDMLGLPSLSLPITADFRFAAGSIGGRDSQSEGGCRRGSLTLRHEARQATLAGLQHSGLQYAVALIEESTAVLSSAHTFDRTLPSSPARHLARYTALQLVSAELQETPIRAGPLAAAPPAPSVLLTRNPLDIALTAAFSSLSHDGFMSQVWGWPSERLELLLRRSRLRLQEAGRDALLQVGEAYTRWADDWQVARRRKETLHSGSSSDGVLLVRMEDLLSSDSALRQLLHALQLTPHTEAMRCLSDASWSLSRPARLLSPSPPLGSLTVSGHYALNESRLSLQQRLLSSSVLAHSSASSPFSLLALLPADAFAAFRSTVDAAATAIEGADWLLYCQEVETLLRDQQKSAHSRTVHTLLNV